MAKLVSKVYGDALFEEAMEKNVLSQWYEEIGALRTISWKIRIWRSF